jgi:hypothetical protein
MKAFRVTGLCLQFIAVVALAATFFNPEREQQELLWAVVLLLWAILLRLCE